MHLGNIKTCHTYFMDGQPLQVVSEHKDVGIIIDSNLKFHSQTTAAANKANHILGLTCIKRTFNSLSTRSLPILYKSPVRPVMEYANVVWGPNYVGNCQILEKVQRSRGVPRGVSRGFRKPLGFYTQLEIELQVSRTWNLSWNRTHFSLLS